MELPEINWIEIIDVLLVAWLIYQLYKIVKGTVAIRIFGGLFAIYLFWKVVAALKMELLTEILGQFIGVGVIALIIVFQQELRRFLLIVGTPDFLNNNKTAKKVFGWMKKDEDESKIHLNEIVGAVNKMAKAKTGALIVMEKQSGISPFVSSYTTIDSVISEDLLESIFFKNSPLHDGALIIAKNRILFAGAVLPISDQKLAGKYGTRHRAAFGITELTDAIVIVVSEETGDVSLVNDNKIQKIKDIEANLKKELVILFGN